MRFKQPLGSAADQECSEQGQQPEVRQLALQFMQKGERQGRSASSRD